MTQVETTKYKSSEDLISNQQGELKRNLKLLNADLSSFNKVYLKTMLAKIIKNFHLNNLNY